MKRSRFFLHLLLPVLLGTAALAAVAGCSKIFPQQKTAGKAEAAVTYYCPMHPTYTSPKPGTCPICNMNLVPLKPHDDHSEHEMKPTDAQNVCLRHECPMLKAGHDCPMLVVSATGEAAECPVCSKRIEEQKEKAPSSVDGLEGYAAVALTPAKRQLIGVRTGVIDARPLRSSLRASGLMLAGGEIDLFVYESDLPNVRDNSTVKAFFPALGRELTGKVSRIPLSADRSLSPTINSASAVLSAASNQVTVRARLEDPDRQLRRGMSADAEILTDLGTVTAVPEEAVFFTGKRSLVFVEKSEGVYEPRAITVGVKAEGYFEVKSGLADGEKVVTSGNFLIDSESRLRSAFADADAAAGTEHAH